MKEIKIKSNSIVINGKSFKLFGTLKNKISVDEKEFKHISNYTGSDTYNEIQIQNKYVIEIVENYLLTNVFHLNVKDSYGFVIWRSNALKNIYINNMFNWFCEKVFR